MDEREQRLVHELALLQKTKWRWSDIKDYFQCGTRQANEQRRKALRAGGEVASDPHAVKVSTVIEINGSNIKTEIEKRCLELGLTTKDGKEQK